MVHHAQANTALAVISRAAEAHKGAPLVRNDGTAERSRRRDAAGQPAFVVPELPERRGVARRDGTCQQE